MSRGTPGSPAPTWSGPASPTASRWSSAPPSTRCPGWSATTAPRLIFIDADKQGYPDYLTWSLRLSRPGTLIVADNVVRDGAVADPASTDPLVLGVRRFAELVATEPRLAATTIQTVGVKGYDGLAFALVLD